jgi:DNA ligase-1
VTFLCARPFARSEDRKLSIGGSALTVALRLVNPEITEEDIQASWLRWSDAGDVAAQLLGPKAPAQSEFSILDMAVVFSKLAETSGAADKILILADALHQMSARGARTFVKIVSGEARTGIRDVAVEEAVATAFEASLEVVRSANRHRGNLGSVAADIAAGNHPDDVFTYFSPVDPMLAQPAESAEEIVERISPPVLIEDKYDGIRCQLHKSGDIVRLYSRDRKEITTQFPDVVLAFQSALEDYTLDGEIMIIENGKIQSFARLQQRLNRVKPAKAVLEANPAGLVIFDILASGGISLLDVPLMERRKTLEAIEIPSGQILALQTQAHSADDIEVLFDAAIARGNEGLMAKSGTSHYLSGRRGAHWMKMKRPLETLDCVVVGAEWGHGKRKDVLSDYTFAVRDVMSGALVTIGKAYGGLTDQEIVDMTERLKASTLAEFGRYRTVRPEIVLEIACNGIQLSARHKSGYALRFPRIARIREDKGVLDISTTADVARIYRASLKADSTQDGPAVQGG